MSLRRFTLVALGSLSAALAIAPSPAHAADPPATTPAPTAPAPAAAPTTAPTPPGGSPTWSTAAPPATPAPAPGTTAAPAPGAAPSTEAAPTTGEASASKSDETDQADEKDSDAEPAAPSNKPSPALMFLQARRKAAQTPQVEQPPADDGLMGSHQRHLFATGGFRFGFIPTSGYDPFSKDNSFVQFSAGAGAVVTTFDDFSAAVSVLWDWGRAEGVARGAKTKLGAHRLTLGLEGRYHVLRRLYAFARVAPGALRSDASIEDGGAGVIREAGDWVMATDLSAGAAFEFAGQARGESKQARGWVLADGGYGWTAASSLSFAAAEGTRPPARLEPLELGELAMRGAFFRLAAAITY